MAPPRLVLASTSAYRRELLARLRLPFEVVAPGVDETARDGEPPAELSLRLAREKASAVAGRLPGAVVIGSDQVAVLGDTALSKPGSHAIARLHLQALRGRRVTFLTAVAVARDASERILSRVVATDVKFRRYSDAAIEAYLRADTPYDCAGAAKIESLGIALVERVDSPDPTALIGLPLIALTDLLAEAGISVLPS
jgi:septum formation protein